MRRPPCRKACALASPGRHSNQAPVGFVTPFDIRINPAFAMGHTRVKNAYGKQYVMAQRCCTPPRFGAREHTPFSLRRGPAFNVPNGRKIDARASALEIRLLDAPPLQKESVPSNLAANGLQLLHLPVGTGHGGQGEYVTCRRAQVPHFHVNAYRLGPGRTGKIAAAVRQRKMGRGRRIQAVVGRIQMGCPAFWRFQPPALCSGSTGQRQEMAQGISARHKLLVPRRSQHRNQPCLLTLGQPIHGKLLRAKAHDGLRCDQQLYRYCEHQKA